VAPRAEPKPAVARPGALTVAQKRFTRQLEFEASFKTGEQLNSNLQPKDKMLG